MIVVNQVQTVLYHEQRPEEPLAEIYGVIIEPGVIWRINNRPYEVWGMNDHTTNGIHQRSIILVDPDPSDGIADQVVEE